MTNQQPNGQTTSLTQNSRTRQITLIGLMTAITCILAPLSIPLPFSPVPISLTNLVIFISVFILGMKDATISFLIYLLLGSVGLPVFASFHAGLSVLAGPTGGYLIGFIFLALIQGFAMKYFSVYYCYKITYFNNIIADKNIDIFFISSFSASDKLIS